MMSRFRLVLQGLIIGCLTYLLQGNVAYAQDNDLFPPIPDDISIIMVQWNPVTGEPTAIRCAIDSVAFGCTADPSRPYPPTNPVTVTIENRYLLDVVSKETNPDEFGPATLRAQAAAARSFGYWHLNNNEAISNGSQAFIPFSFENGGAPDNPDNLCASTNLDIGQRKVCTAVAAREYMVYLNETAPIFAAYNADIVDPTQTFEEVREEYGRDRYLIGVAEPISPNGGCGVGREGNQFGMSQQGASRWERGNICFTGNPRDPWSVQWSRAEQILTHYYTRIHIRSIDNDEVQTPSLRWNPLDIRWDNIPNGEPPVVIRGEAYQVRVNVQNNGTRTWFCEEGITYTLQSTFSLSPRIQIQQAGETPVCDLAPGENRLVTLNVTALPNLAQATYRLNYDVVRTNSDGTTSFFSDAAQNPPGGWATYTQNVCVECDRIVFLPSILVNRQGEE
jgi:hypothetical protein